MVVAVIAGAVIAGAVIVGAILMGDGPKETPPPTFPPSPDSRPVGTATITLSPKSGPAGTRISVSGEAFRPSEEVEIKFHVWGCGSATADDLGAFTGATCTVPSDIKPGTFIVVGRGRTSGEWDEADFKLT